MSVGWHGDSQQVVGGASVDLWVAEVLPGELGLVSEFLLDPAGRRGSAALKHLGFYFVGTRKRSPHQLVVFGQTLRPAGGASLDLRNRGTSLQQEDPVLLVLTQRTRILTHLSGAKSNHQVRDEGVLRLSRTMADHHTPPAALSQLTPETRRDGETGV